MATKASRITSDEVQGILAQAQRRHSKYLTVAFLDDNRRENRYAIVVSKKVDTRATLRNRIRRVISEWIRINEATIVKGYDIIIIVKPGAASISAQQLRDEINRIFKRLN